MSDIPCKRYKCDFWDVQGNYCYANRADKNASYDCPLSKSLLDLIKAELDKLTLLNDEEIRASHPYWRNLSYNALMRLIVITQAQLQHTKKELLDLMGKIK